MKRKLMAALLALALLASAYTAYACLATRGMRVYLMGTRLGAVLAGSWQFTLLAAVLLWLPCLTLAAGKVRGLRRKKAVSSAAETEKLEEALEPTELIEPRGGALAETELLEETELLKDAEDAPAPEPPEAPGSPELLIEPRRAADQAETEIVLDLEPTEPLSLVKEEASPAEEAETEVPALKTPLLVCPNCGHPVAGKRFCAKCGTRVGE